MTFEKYLALTRLAHSVKSYEEFIAELSKLAPEDRVTPKEGWEWFYGRYTTVNHPATK
jgi:hypothetical protein